MSTFNSMSRRAAADAALLDYSFGDLVVADYGGWEITQPGLEYKRAIFFEDPDGGDSIMGHFTVAFDNESSNRVRQAYGILQGDLIGQARVIYPTSLSP